MLTINHSNYQVDFSQPNSIKDILGFNHGIYKYGVHESRNIVNILTINSIFVNINIIDGSYINGEKQPVIFSFFPNVSPGEKIVETPQNLVYLPIIMKNITDPRLIYVVRC